MFTTDKFLKANLIILILTLTILVMISGCILNDKADAIIHLDGQSNRISEEEKEKIINIQLAEDLKIALLNFEYIEDALVVVNLGVSQTSPDDEKKVSVLLTILNDAVLSEIEIRPIFDIIIGVVSGITYEDISLTDINLNIYKPYDKDVSILIKDGAIDEVIDVRALTIMSEGNPINEFTMLTGEIIELFVRIEPLGALTYVVDDVEHWLDTPVWSIDDASIVSFIIPEDYVRAPDIMTLEALKPGTTSLFVNVSDLYVECVIIVLDSTGDLTDD